MVDNATKFIFFVIAQLKLPENNYGNAGITGDEYFDGKV